MSPFLLGEKSYYKVSLDRNVYDFLSRNHCQKALNLDFILYRKDVVHAQPDLVKKAKKQGG